jgi:Asp-tRNA(Asn)/Glu-tRNA(Gln) amidotransferase A subunit family amidase
MQHPEHLSATEAAGALERGELTSEALARACIECIERREPVVRAWSAFSAESLLAQARALDRMPRRSALQGVPIAIKDILDTHDFPTGYGSSIYAGHRPRADAAVVATLRDAGALIAGKTVTTELAYFTPGPTTNPANRAHTPGGSSSGSAAAVAAGMVPLALGTQTAGSVTRPASYCGIVGFKPTYGRMNLTGAKPFAPGLDTLGLFARSVDDIELLRSVLAGEAWRPLAAPDGRLRVGIYRGADWWPESSSAAAVDAAATALRECADVAEIDRWDAARGLVDAQKTIMAYEAARSLADEYRRHRDALSAPLVALIESGRAIRYADYVGAYAAAHRAKSSLRALLDAHDVIVAPSATGEAPAGLDATGDPVFSRAWTMLGVPTLTIPTHAGSNGLPIGVQIVGGWDADRRLLAIGQWSYRRLRPASR